MKILSIETSCDETSVAVVEDGVKVLGMTTYSQALKHSKTGGVVPEVASREHSVKIIPCVSHVMQTLAFEASDIDMIAVTAGPGLIGSLLVGVETAKALAYAWGKPLIPVHHIYGHIVSVWLGRSESDILFPAVVLTASGGHNDLYLLTAHGSLRKLGSTLDDAAGEAFDKVATMLGLSYPGGPHISALAVKGNPGAFPFPRAHPQGLYSFSFSGIKTAVKYCIRDLTSGGRSLSDQQKADIAASFQEAIIDMLAQKVIQAVQGYRAQSLLLAGGVSANVSLRTRLEKECKKHQLDFFTPTAFEYCTDNAAMIGCAAYFQWKYTEELPSLLEITSFPRRELLL